MGFFLSACACALIDSRVDIDMQSQPFFLYFAVALPYDKSTFDIYVLRMRLTHNKGFAP